MSGGGGEVPAGADGGENVDDPMDTGAEAAAASESSPEEVSSPEIAVKNKDIWQHYTLGPVREKRLMKSKKPGEPERMKRPDRKAVCKHCESIITRTEGTTSSMRNHLARKHPGKMRELLDAELKTKKTLDREQSDLDEAYEATDDYRGQRLRKLNLQFTIIYDS
jgi:hypothetical protein